MEISRANDSDVSMSEMGKAVYYRTYSRNDNDIRENFSDTVDRIINHQKWLWERQLGKSLDENQSIELEKLRNIYLSMKALPRR